MSSSYWHSEMNKISKQIDSLDDKIEDYSNYKQKLIKLDSNIEKIYKNMSEVKSVLLDGGFNYGGDVPLEDEFHSTMKDFNNNIKELEKIIKKIELIIEDELIPKKDKLTESYKTAESNYNKAKKEENG